MDNNGKSETMDGEGIINNSGGDDAGVSDQTVETSSVGNAVTGVEAEESHPHTTLDGTCSKSKDDCEEDDHSKSNNSDSVGTDGGSKASSKISFVASLEGAGDDKKVSSGQRGHSRRAKQNTDSTHIMSNKTNTNMMSDAGAASGFFGSGGSTFIVSHQNSGIYGVDADDGSMIADDLTDEGDRELAVTQHIGHHGNHDHGHNINQEKSSMSWGRGIVYDFNTTARLYWKMEMTNFNTKTIAVSLFLFFACLAPAITFGAMYSKVTHNMMGTVEMLVATAWCGIYFVLVGGQPVMINGGTGPVLAFSGVLFKLSESIGVPFLTFNAWCGLWVCFYMLLAAFVDLNRVIRFATRFTDEIFALLIAAIFIIDALASPFNEVGIYYYFTPSHDSHDQHADDANYDYMTTALLSLCCCIGTTVVAYWFRGLKHSPYFWWKWLRHGLSDFSVSISIFIFSLIANFLFWNVKTEELKVPATLAPTFECCTAACDTNWPDDCPEQEQAWGRRPWFVDLFDLNGQKHVPVLAAVPALLAFILIFLDDGITKHLMNHPCHKLQHGTAYNYDTVVIGLMIAVNSMFGLPWLVAATVRSMNHLHALAEKSSDGKTIISVMETRLTGLLAHLGILGSLFVLDLIKLIPVPVLYGVFLYMGLTTLPTNQFFNRCLLFFSTPTHYDQVVDEPFVENIKPKRIHMFTCIQLVLFALLYCIKGIKPIAIAFPIIIAACIPVRLYLLPKWFTSDELILLDSGDDAEISQWLEEHGQTRKVRILEKHHNDDEVHGHYSLCSELPFDNVSLASKSQAQTV